MTFLAWITDLSGRKPVLIVKYYNIVLDNVSRFCIFHQCLSHPAQKMDKKADREPDYNQVV
jgi:hypothetical protein